MDDPKKSDKGQNRCLKPEELIGKPEDCTPEQIKKCHGDEEHSCAETE